MRRICYLHNVLKREKTSMLYRFFITQWLKPCRGDWVLQAQKDLEDFNIAANIDEISSFSCKSFKKYVRVKAEEYALGELRKLQAEHSKLKDLDYVDLQIRPYFQDENLSVNEKITIFKYRTRMANYENNFKRGKPNTQKCPVCHSHSDTQELAFQCSFLRKKIAMSSNYKDIFTDTIGKNLAKTLVKIEELREYFIT